MRGAVVESEHRGHVVEVDVDGRILRVLGDPERVVLLRSALKPFGLVSLIEAGGIEAFDLQAEDLALLASSHSGEDVHVRTLQGLFRRAGISQALLACGTEGMPLDALTAARLARDGERPSPVRHTCSGQHAAAILHSRMRSWPLETYWHDDHPAQLDVRRAVARAFGVATERMKPAIDDCGLPTYAFSLAQVARAYALLAQPDAVPASDGRSSVAEPLTRVRDAMLEHPEMVGGTRDRLDTSLMKAAPRRMIGKSAVEGVRAVAILPGDRAGGAAAAAGGSAGGVLPATGLGIKIEDGGGHDRALWAATVEALAQAGALSGQAVRALGRYHRPQSHDPHGRMTAEAVASFELAPVGELIA